mmetsp:Transcript_58525/g.151242  ORF Transcript_58525/g.151242 Transcript_58525/m.151242 type:complete len:497 (+) Transcript_58525:67-1557(+)
MSAEEEEEQAPSDPPDMPALPEGGKSGSGKDEEEEGGGEDRVDEETAEADFDKEAWAPADSKYGILGLLNLWEAMKPIEKPEEVATLKLLVFPKYEVEGAGAEADRDAGGSREDRRLAKGKGKGQEGKLPEPPKGGGRFVADMGKTEVQAGSRRGHWWRNCAEGNLDVIVRDQFSLYSTELCKIPPGGYVQQSGGCEIFVSGPAAGLQRMPVFPRGWATVDASTVGGPKYLEMVRKPTWKIIYKSGSAKGDIVVRESLSLDSKEVAVLSIGSRVEQSGPQEIQGDGIVRMPITFGQGIARDPSDASRPARVSCGWVTCDATSQGGPRFFEPCADEEPTAGGAASSSGKGGGDGKGTRANRNRERDRGDGDGDWDKSRMWKVVNAGGSGDRKLAIVTRPEPFAPGRAPPDDMLLKYVNEGDVLEQIGHSKKMRGFMVMPVHDAGGSKGDGGWITRRVVDKTRDVPEDVWFVELRNGIEVEPRDRRRGNLRGHGVDED